MIEHDLADRRPLLSTIWVFALFNYLYCDVLGLMDPVTLNGYLAGNVGGIAISQDFLLAGGVLMEIPIMMVLLSRVLKHRANRWANVVAGTVMTVVQSSTLIFGSKPSHFYIFFSVVEIAATALIIWYAWTWRPVRKG